MKSKRAIMGFAALLVVMYHFYIPVFRNSIETFLYRGSYIGVDLFFLVSACSMGKQDKIEFLPFIKNRLKGVYIPFIIMALMMFFYKKWKIKKLLLVLCGADFIMSGGGSFLWFAPGIMFFYLITPFLVMLKRKLGLKGLPVMLAGWFLLCLVLQYGFGYNKAFILLNRLPVFFLGLYYDRLSVKNTGKFRIAADIALLALGAVLVYRFGTNIRLNKPFADMYYVLALPEIMAAADIIEMISEKIRLVPLEFIGAFTLELYGLQMIYGYDIEAAILKASGKPAAAFSGVIAILIVMAFIFSKIIKLLRGFTESGLKRSNSQ